MMKKMFRKFLAATLLCSAFLSAPAFALSEPEEIVNKAKVTAESMFSDPNYPVLLDLVNKSKAVLIVPNFFKAGFFIGGQGGAAALLSRDDSGAWGSPAFYQMGGPSFGLQFGAQSSEIIIVIMTNKGLNAVMNRRVTLGTDAGAALGQVGTGVKASTGVDLKADMYAFARSAGLFFGVSLDGTVVWPRRDFNNSFYGTDTTPEAILLQHTVQDPRAQPLIDVMPR